MYIGQQNREYDMTKREIVNSAAGLKRPSVGGAEEFGRSWEAAAVAVDKVMLARQDLERLVGPGNSEMMRNNHRNHFRYMESIFHIYDPARFVETVLWVFRTYRAHGFSAAYWPAMLDTTVTVLEGVLSREAFREVLPFYTWLITHIPAFTTLSEVEDTVWERPHSIHDHVN